MQNNINSTTSNPNTAYQFNLNYKRLMSDFIRYWWLFLLSLLVAVGVVFFSLRYTIPIYQATSTILMEDENSRSSSQENMMEGFGLNPGMRSIENQIAILTSWDVVYETIKRLDFATSYYVVGNVKKTELYKTTPFTVFIDSLKPQLVETPIYIFPLDATRFKLVVEDSERAQMYDYKQFKISNIQGGIKRFEGIFNLGEVIETPFMRIIITSKTSLNPNDETRFFMFHTYESLASQYRSRFSARKMNENSSIVRITVSGTNSEKNMSFLNMISDVFIEFNLAKKNQIASNTIRFIENQLSSIRDSMLATGSQLSSFRTENNLISIESKGEQLYKGIDEKRSSLSELVITKNYYLYLSEYFVKSDLNSDVIAPAIFQVENPIISESISKIMEINTQILVAREQSGEGKNPFEKDLINQKEVLRLTMLQAINNQLQVIDKNINSLNQEVVELENSLQILPETERKLVGIQRKFELNSEVFTYLLRKRSESQIQKASNTPDHQVLERARFSGQIYPTPDDNYKKGLIIGFLLPLIFIVIKQLLDNKISSSEDIEKISSFPVIGHVIHSEKPNSLVVLNFPKSVVAETFRRIRTRLDFMNMGKEIAVFAVSSSMPNEGKTFCALNIASAYAIAGKKTVLCGFDLRKPGLNNVLGLKDLPGISNYLISEMSLDDILLKTEYLNFTVITSGPIPPNPAELISSSMFHKMIAELKERFDVIILDTPPMGIVSDTFVLARHVDSLVFVTRQNFSVKGAFASTINNLSAEGLNNVGIILNDVDIKKDAGKYGRYGYNYKYGYNYGYSYGYYEE